MDVTFKTDQGRFNYRVCAIIINDEKILAMHDERSPYYYLPGGRVKFHETAEFAILRELKEELQIDAEIIRPLWLNQAFFTEDVDNDNYHELCLYFLIDISKTDLLENGRKFTLFEGTHRHVFEWLLLSGLKDTYIYPLFIKEEIFNLPSELTVRAEFQ